MNMKCVQWTLALVALGLGVPTAVAQAPTKVGIINVQGAILATKDGEKAREAIRTKFEPKAKGMESKMADLNQLRDQYNKGANTMAAEAREKISREIEDKQKKYQWESEDLQNELQQEEQKLVNEIGTRMVAVIDEYAKGAGLAIVFDVSGQQSPVLWAANGIDITTQIVEAYDKKFGPGGAGATAAPPAPAAAKPAAPKPAAAGAVKK